MAKIKRFIECLMPCSICNLECSYCYIIQENQRAMKMADLKYSPETIAYALRPERMGGTCWISLCGLGETLCQKEIIEIAALLLKEGHYVNITTNGTLSGRFDELIRACKDNISHLQVAFSWHFVELKKKDLMDTFFENIKKVRASGASILLQLNLCDEYIPYIDDIKEISMNEVGAYPQIALTRNEKTDPISIFSSLSNEEYYEIGKTFDSPLFDFTYKNFGVKRKEFCYAGDWSGALDLQTGILTKCYNSNESQNIFEDPDRPIDFSAIGRNCKSAYCANSSHFMSFGVIPSIKTPSYADLRNRPEGDWYSDEMLEFLNSRLYESNRKYNILKRWRVEWKNNERERNRLKATVKAVLPDKWISKIDKG